MKRIIRPRMVFKIFDAAHTLNCTEETTQLPFECSFYTSSEISQGEISIYFYVSLTSPELIREYGKTATLKLNKDQTVTIAGNNCENLNFWNNVGRCLQAERML